MAMIVQQTCRIGLLLTILCWSFDAWSLPAAVKSFSMETPPPFGYVIGDLIKHNVGLSAEKPFQLVDSLLPQPGPVNHWLELREIHLKQSLGVNQTQYRIELVYQLFRGVKETEKLAIPAWNIQLRSRGETLEIPVPQWSFSYAPLIPGRTPDNQVTIRTPIMPATQPIIKPASILAGSLVGLASILLYFAWLHDRLPIVRRNPGPFASAYRKLKKLNKKDRDIQSYCTALRTIHHAFDETAGKTVFADRLELLFAAKPAFQNLTEDTERFFEISRQVFYLGQTSVIQSQYPISRLTELCRRYRAVEH